jgi:hypothetical protein
MGLRFRSLVQGRVLRPGLDERSWHSSRCIDRRLIHQIRFRQTGPARYCGGSCSIRTLEPGQTGRSEATSTPYPPEWLTWMRWSFRCRSSTSRMCLPMRYYNPRRDGRCEHAFRNRPGRLAGDEATLRWRRRNHLRGAVINLFTGTAQSLAPSKQRHIVRN